MGSGARLSLKKKKQLTNHHHPPNKQTKPKNPK